MPLSKEDGGVDDDTGDEDPLDVGGFHKGRLGNERS
jgi:hypothetical protein